MGYYPGSNHILVTHCFRVEDFDLDARADLDPDDTRAQFAALGPAWRGAHLRSASERTDQGQAYLNKWKILPVTNDEVLALNCAP